MSDELVSLELLAQLAFFEFAGGGAGDRFDELKRVVYEPVRLTQEFRNFDFLSPWEGTDYVLPGDEKASGKGS